MGFEDGEMTQASDPPMSEIAFVGLVLTLLIVFPALILLGLGVADPYPLGGVQSARWWWLRYPIVFAGLLVIATLQIIVIKQIDDEDFAKDVEKAADASNGTLLAAALVIVTFGGGTLMNLYNAAYGERLIVKARRAGTTISAPGYRSAGSTSVRYEILEGPWAGESITLYWSGTGDHGRPADVGKPALVGLRRSWMGISIVGAYDQEVRAPANDR